MKPSAHPAALTSLPGALVALVALVACEAGSPARGADARRSADASAGAPDLGPSEVGPTAEPWVTIAPNRTYLMHEDGRPFFPLGVAMPGSMINLDHFGQTTIAGRPVTFSEDHFEQLFASMAAHSENLLRVDVEGTSLFPRPDIERLIAEGKLQFLEDPVGTFNEAYARRIDRLLSLAERYGIWLDLVLITHTCDVTVFADNLDLYPYHVAQGGPLRSMDDLFTVPAAREAWKRRLEYISDRWGGSKQIYMWELYNELLNCGGTDAAAAGAWVDEMGQHLRARETATYGRAHLIGVSTVNLVPVEPFFHQSPGIDLVVVHHYGLQNGSGNPVRIARELREGLASTRRLAGAKPVVENERTLGSQFSERLQREMEHYAAWTEVASGVASAGATWMTFGEAGAYRSKRLVEDTHRAMRPILDRVDFAGGALRPVAAECSNAEVVPMVVADTLGALGWLMHDNTADFDIENLELWRQGSDDVPPVSSSMTGAWVALLEADGRDPGLAPFIARIAALLADAFGVTLEQAEGLASAFLRGELTKAQQVLISRHTGEAGQAGELLEALRPIFVDLKAHLEGLETRHGTLQRAYRGHPEVTTTLAVRGFAAGAYRITWFDDTTGAELGSQDGTGPVLALSPPAFSKHLAFVVEAVAPGTE